MNQQNDKSQVQNSEKLKEISKWTRRYAENRTLPFLIEMSTVPFIWAAVGVPSYFGGKAYRSGNMALFGLCVSLLTLVSVALIFFSFTKWDEKFTDRISRRLYGSEGMVTLAIPKKTKRQRRAGWIAGLLFGVCVTISVILVVFCKIPIKYMQPVSAICFIPLNYSYRNLATTICQSCRFFSMAMANPLCYSRYPDRCRCAHSISQALDSTKYTYTHSRLCNSM